MGEYCFGLRFSKEVQHCRRRGENVKGMHRILSEQAVLLMESRIVHILEKRLEGWICIF